MSKKNLGKKAVSVALVSTMAASMLAGCGSSTDQAASSNTSTTTATTTETKNDTAATTADGKVKINVTRASFNLASPDSAEVTAIQNAINDYIADKIDVEITLTDIGSGEFTDKANLALANNEINLLWTASWEQTIGCDDLVKANAVYDLTPLMEGSTLYSSIPAWVWDASAYDGKTYFVSCYKESAEGYDLMFRKDLVDKYGWDLSSVKTLKDIEPMLEDCKAEGLKYPYLTQKTAMFFRYFLNDYDFFAQQGWIGIDRDTNTVVNTVASDEYKEFAHLMAQWADKGYLSEDDATKTTTDTTTQTQDWGISWWTDVPNNLEANTRYGQEVQMVPVTNKYSHSTTTLGSCFAVTANSTEEQAKACVDFLGLLYTDKTLADLYTFGIEGVDYDRDADGAIVKKGDMYNHSAWESCSVLNLSLEAGEPADKVELYAKFNDSSESSCASGFRFDKSKIEAQYSACLNVFEQYGFVLENGGFAEGDVDAKIDEYLKALDDAGYQDILAEATAQYEAWKATK